MKGTKAQRRNGSTVQRLSIGKFPLYAIAPLHRCAVAPLRRCAVAPDLIITRISKIS